MSRPIVLTAIFMAALLLSQKGHANHLVVEGTLRDKSGAANGTNGVRFSLFAQGTGGSPLWSEEQPAIAFAAGYFQARLGDSSPLDEDLFATHPSLWLQTAIKPPGAQTFTDFGTRIPLETDPYAFRALSAAVADDAATVGGFKPAVTPTANGLLVLDTNGKVPALAMPVVGSLQCSGCVDSTDIADGAISLVKLSGFGCAQGNVAKWNGVKWACATDDGTTYTGSPGVIVSGTLITLDQDFVKNLARAVSYDAPQELANALAGWDQDAGDDLTLGTLFSGDVAGAYSTMKLKVGAVSFAHWASNSCQPGEVPKFDGAKWACGSDASSTEAEVDAFVANNGYVTLASLPTVAKTGKFSDLLSIPAGLANGDDDALGKMTCEDGQVAKRVNGDWACAADIDTTSTEAQVDAFVSNNGYAAASSLAAVATTGKFADLLNIPAGLGNGDDDTLSTLACPDGQLAKRVAGAWACAADVATAVTEAQVDAYVADNGFASTESLAVVATTGKFADLLNIPAGLGNGDDDTLAALACPDGQLAKRVAGAWACAADVTTAVTEAQVDAYVANNGFASSASLPLVATTGKFSDLLSIPVGLANGDDDILGGLSCQDGEIAKRVSGNWLCRPDLVLTEAQVDAYTANNGYAASSSLAVVADTGQFSDLLQVPAGLANGDDDTLSGLPCTDGQIAKRSAGSWGCAADLDTITTEAQVDAYVGNNGYVASNNLATVATTGKYSDLLGKPDITAMGIAYNNSGSGLLASTAQAAVDELAGKLAATGTSAGRVVGTLSSRAELLNFASVTQHIQVVTSSTVKVLAWIYGQKSGVVLPKYSGDVSKLVNSYVGGATGTKGGFSLVTNRLIDFHAGDNVLIHQSVGGSPGLWEFNMVDEVMFGALLLRRPLSNNYAGAQVVRGETYGSVRLIDVRPSRGLGQLAEGGVGGGIVYIVADSITMFAGDRVASFEENAGGGGGFAGASILPALAKRSGSSECSLAQGSDPSNNCSGGGAPTGTCKSLCSSGGGGGGNKTAGGSSGAAGVSQGGFAKGTANAVTLEFGGGGGGGFSTGGEGGGIVVLVADRISISAGASVAVSGSAGAPILAPSGYGAGGGGAGGTVLLKANTLVNAGTVSTLGGAGGTSYATYNGGAGGDGWFYTMNSAPANFGPRYPRQVAIMVDGVDVTAALGNPNLRPSSEFDPVALRWGTGGEWSTGKLDLTSLGAWSEGEHTVTLQEFGGVGGTVETLVMVAVPGSAGAPPSNDTCAGATSVTLSPTPTSVGGTTEDTLGEVRATDDYNAPFCGGDGGLDVVYALKTTTAGPIIVRLAGPYQRRMYLRAGNCMSGPTIACGSSTLSTGSLSPGTYYLFVDADSAQQKGDFNLTASSP